MTAILFSTLKGAPIAVLLLSTPTMQARQCIFSVAAQNVEIYDGVEGQVLLPDRPVEYDCSLTTGRSGTRVEFNNQNGWHFSVHLDRRSRGQWSATKAAQTLSGLALGL
jgi:hypothetical protein